MSIELRPYQRQAVDSIYEYFRSGGRGNPLVVAPTGSGKSIIVAKLIEESMKAWPKQRILMLSHRKELLSQNFSKLISIWPEAPVGIYSAGLNSKKIRKITIAGIASIYKKVTQLGFIDLILIDECHLVNHEDDGMYRKLISELLKTNPALKVVGFTATAYRMKTGMLIEEGGLFTDICYDIDLSGLVKEGFLAPLISKQPKTQADLTEVHVRGGEFIPAEAEAAMDDNSLTDAAITEMEHYLANRRSWIIFCAGVDHANHVTEALNRRGHTAECVIGDSDDMFRDQVLGRFKRGELKCLVNCNVLTTGFDAPRIDALVLLRPTKSIGLYVQMCGRGMRTCEETGKIDCIVLDFAGNIERHGPIDAIKIRKKRNGDGTEITSAPVKICPQCNTAVAISVRNCPDCGYEFPISAAPPHDTSATTKDIMVTVRPPEKWNVSGVTYRRHDKVGSPSSLKVTYDCYQEGGNLLRKQVSLWCCLEHRGYAFSKAVEFWLSAHKLHGSPAEIKVPTTVDSALKETDSLRRPSHIFVQQDGKFDRVVSYIYPEFSEGDELEPEPDFLTKHGINI